MSIVGAAFLPHTPLLLPTTDPPHAKRMRGLRQAVEDVVAWSHAAQPDIILCFNPHAASVGNQFTFNLAERYHAAFDEFGDLTTKLSVAGSPTYAYRLKERLEAILPVANIIEPRINYGTGLAASFFSQLQPQPTWIEVSSRRTNLADHLAFGARLQELLLNSRERVLILATGEVTARLTEASPQGRSPEAASFRKHWGEALRNGTLQQFLSSVPPAQVETVASCGAWSVAQLLGTIISMRTHTRVLYDEALYGVGYVAATWQPA